jgi:hypothetical protein
MENTYKKGDITKTGYEVVEVNMRPEYKVRKRVKVNNEVWDPVYIGKEGWIYLHLGYSWVELDDYPDKQFKFREKELDF